jgi:hypothetical protein
MAKQLRERNGIGIRNVGEDAAGALFSGWVKSNAGILKPEAKENPGTPQARRGNAGGFGILPGPGFQILKFYITYIVGSYRGRRSQHGFPAF